MSAVTGAGARGGLIRDALHVLGGTVGAQVIGVVKGLVLPLLVSPAQFGAWRVVQLIWQYGFYLHLGSFAIVNRELPGLLAGGRDAEAADERTNALWGTLAVTGLAALAVAGAALAGGSWLGEAGPFAIGLAAAGLLVQQVGTYEACVFRSRAEFGRMSVAALAASVLGLALSVALAPRFGVDGLVAGTVVGMLASTVVFARAAGFDRPRLRLPKFAAQAREGFALGVVPMLVTGLTTVAHGVCATIFDAERTGYLGIGAMMGSAVLAVPNALGMALYPRLLTQLARSAEPGTVGPLLRRSLRVASVASVAAVCGGIVLLDPLLEHVLPAYRPGLGAARIQLAGMALLAHLAVVQNAMIALRRQGEILVALGAALGVSGAAALAAGLLEGTLESLAWGAFAGQAVASVLVVVRALALTGPRASLPGDLARALAPGAALALVTAGVMSVGTAQVDLPAPWVQALRLLVVAGLAGVLLASEARRARAAAP